MKLNLSIVLFLIYSLAMLEVTNSSKQLFEKLNKKQKEGSFATNNDFLKQDNVMDFFQKVKC